MQKLTCFVIIPSNRPDGTPLDLVRDKKWGWVELPSTCERPSSNADIITVDFDSVYNDIIQAAIELVNRDYQTKGIEIECVRGQDLMETGSIVKQLMEQICRADITITDVTAHNPNVFLELGIRLSLKDPLNILISYKETVLPFNITQERHIPYSTVASAATEAKKRIAGFIRLYLDQRGKISSASEGTSQLKGYVELYSERELERKLLTAFEEKKATKLVTEFAEFLFESGKESPKLENRIFKLLESIRDALKQDPERCIDHLELMTSIKGLDKNRLNQIYYDLWEVCDSNGFKEKADYYFRLLEG